MTDLSHKGDLMRFFLLFILSGLVLNAADTKHNEMDYGDALFMSLDTDSPEGEQMVRKALVQRLATQALPDRGTPIGKGRVIKVKDDIEGTELDKIYQYQRERSSGYLISIPEGEYKVTLQFAEIKRKNTGERVFDILLQQKLIKSDFDPLAVTGAQFKAIDIVVEKVKVKKFLRLEFVQKSTRSTPAIAGIVIEGKGFTKKINCGGDKESGYEEDWDKNEYMEDPFSTGIIFDTELLRYSAAWLNGFVKLKGTAYDATHGTHPEIQGDQVWGSGYIPGWVPAGKKAVDPRKDHLGHLPKDWAHYKGFYRHNDGNVIKYSVAGSTVLDKMELLKIPAKVAGQAYVRTVQTENLKAASDVLLFEVPGENVKFEKPGNYFKSEDGFVVSIKGLTVDGLKTSTRKIGEENFTSVFMNVPAGKQHFSVAIFKSDSPESDKVFETTLSTFKTPDLNSFTKGSSLRWEGTVKVAGVKGKDEGPFTVDEIVMPENNPWRSWMRPGAFDFTADGKSMYMSTWSGDVWKAENLDDISKLEWKRYAAGLFHPLGLKVVDGKIYVQCRDQIAILHDLNNDGEADYYENFNNDVVITENFHEFSFELNRDKAGNFYFVKGAPVVAGGEGFGEMKVHHGKLFKVSPDGSKLEVIASGFRAPNGMGMSPDGQLTTSDNEGNWVAATPINWIEEGGFYGVQPTALDGKVPEKRSPIVCWIPHKVDNSAGGQVWIPKGNWGPYGGEMLHISYGQAKLFHVLKETVKGQVQGGVVDLKPTGGFEAGIMRGRFNEKDKAVYLAGLKGWQTKGIKDGGVYRVRYTGQKKCRPIGLSVGANGVKVTFSEPVKEESALDAGNYDISRWVYEISDKYGSKHYKIPKGRDWALQSDWSPLPKEELEKFAKLKFKDEAAKKAALTHLYDKYVGEDQVKIASISLSDDKKTVFLEIPDIAPVMQMKVSFDIESASNAKVKNDIYHTIHKLGEWKGTPGKKILTSDLSKPKSGLIAVFKHKGQNKTDARVQRMAAFYIGEKTPVTQFLDHGLFETSMDGFIKAERNMKAKFFALGSGNATMSINGQVVFRDFDFAKDQAYEVQLKKGFNKLNINYTSPEKGSAYFRLYWEAIEYFPKEPVPASVLFHEGGNKDAIESHLKRKGLSLALENNCFSCHDTGRDVQIPELKTSKISLNDLGSRLNTAWVSEWLKNPKNLRHNANMPMMLKNLPEAEWDKAAKDISTYLTADGKESKLEGGDAKLGEVTFGELGCASCHTFESEVEDGFAISLKYAGFKFKAGALKEFLLNPKKHNASIKMPDFKLSADEAGNLAKYIRSASSQRKAEKVSGDAVSGAKYFAKLNCASCHDYKEAKGKTIAGIFGKSGGCLTSGGDGKPYYGLDQKDRDALTLYLSKGQESLAHNDPIEFSNRAIESYNCTSCHTRDGQAANWKSSINLPSSIPPSLTHTGEKIPGDFLTKIFTGELDGKMRPWMKARMPKFDQHAEVLAEGLNAAHGFSNEKDNLALGAEQVTGSKLIQQTGFACIICHGVGDTKALAPFAAPGPNLQLAGQRLRHEYYLRWMLNPQRAEPTTPMTKFSNDHKKTAVKEFDGDATKQFNAIWDYIKALK